MKLRQLSAALLLAALKDDSKDFWLAGLDPDAWPALRGHLEIEGANYVAALAGTGKIMVVSMSPFDGGSPMSRSTCGMALGLGRKLLAVSEGFAALAAKTEVPEDFPDGSEGLPMEPGA